MGSILVRGFDQKTIQYLKERAQLNGRSLQQEVKAGSVDSHAPVTAHRRGWSAHTGRRSSQPRFLSFRITKASAKLRTGSRPASLVSCSRTGMRCSAWALASAAAP